MKLKILFQITDISSKNLDANERGYALIGKPEDMHTWFFLYDESMRVEPEDNEPMHNLNATYGNHTNYGGHNGKHRVDLSASISVPNLDHSDPVGSMPPAPGPPPGATSGHNYNYFPGNIHHLMAGHPGQQSVQPSQSQPPPQGPPGQGASNSHQQQAQHNFMMYGHAQSVHAAAPPTPPLMDHAHGHAHHCNMGGSLNQHHSR